MKKILKFSFFLALCVLLAACSRQGKQSLVHPTTTLQSFVATPATRTMVRSTSMPKATETLTFRQQAIDDARRFATLSAIPTPIPTSTATPYPLKQVLLDYTEVGSHTPYDIYYADYGNNGWSALVLYTDGQLIIPGKTFQQKILSKEEINQLFLQLESKGYFSLTQDNLYNFGNQEPPKVYDATSYCIMTSGEREQNLCAYEPYESFLVPQMKNLLHFIDQYHPKGMTLYSPDRILLWVQAGRISYGENLPAMAISWPANLSSLETPNEKMMYFHGDEAKEIYALFGNKISTLVLSQNNREYTVSIDIVLPHEQLALP